MDLFDLSMDSEVLSHLYIDFTLNAGQERIRESFHNRTETKQKM